ncbi:C-x8-C-x5-C-x3-H type zinc finger protein [Pleurostoma richardsiae]|uniref:C-x8-C-x5-C-x3-H type zinc finger protein n=1 Tax=Pleurostoma richardsiae TaxID=41990 RepID=A0AA38VKT2_9PEZI|nr:C-x8-C-x5-C-x3-H type zinc finger protein [Pleurostoma richardsiae]
MNKSNSPGAMQYLCDRFDEFADMDRERNRLIIELLRKLADSETFIKQLQLDLEDQTRSRTSYQQDARDLQDKNRNWEQLINKDSFVAVLIDGDGAKFLDGLLQDPTVGAVEAASRLKQAVKDYLEATALAYMDLPVLVRVYANLNGLAKALRLSNVIEHDDNMQVFAETFTNSRWELDFVNVGHGKENADSKLRKMLNHFMKNIQCKRVFFAGCHDNSYLHDLREHAGDERVVLVETTAAEPGFRSLNLPITRFDNKGTRAGVDAVPKAGSIPSGGAAENYIIRICYTIVPFGGKRHSVRECSIPAQDSYSTKLDEIKPKVFCNKFYLTGTCTWGDKCDKDHSTELTPAELAIHRYKARTNLCGNGPDCYDYNCYMSHHCMYGPNCTRAPNCKFAKTQWGDLHLSKEDLKPATRWTEGEDTPKNLQ